MSATAAAAQAHWATATVNLDLLAPAFLGGTQHAQQQEEWRTPPLKALLRQWWRVVWWPKANGDLNRLRAAEAERFGAVQNSAHVSRVRMRLEGGAPGVPWAHDKGPSVAHREVEQNGGKTNAWLYLGYGPIPTTEQAVFEARQGPVWRLAFPPEYQAELRAALQLAHWFGAIGSRSRNAWGSVALRGEGIQAWDPAAVAAELDRLMVARPLGECLRQDWPAAIGKDAKGPLAWQSAESYGDWRKAMEKLAELKIALRVSLPPGRQDGPLAERHLLGLPVTNHKFSGQGNSTRWAAQLRFKLVRYAQDQLRLVAVHLPAHLDPKRLGVGVRGGGGLWERAAQQKVWEEVHGWLDGNSAWRRIGGKQ
jgi:CRISPR-associated protein Cmr1